MGPKDVIRNLMESTDFVLKSYLQDLSDADLLTQPGPNANIIAWQLGHLIQSELQLLKTFPGATSVELPVGWEKQHGKENAGKDPPIGFRNKAEYLELYEKVRGNSLRVLESLADTDLDRPTTGRFASIAPTWGAMFVLIANHPMMHAGQIAVLRRKLNKPIVI